MRPTWMCSMLRRRSQRRMVDTEMFQIRSRLSDGEELVVICGCHASGMGLPQGFWTPSPADLDDIWTTATIRPC